MSTAAVPALRLLSFGDLQGRVWGGVLDAGSGPAVVVGGADGEHAAGSETIDLSLDDGTWRLTGNGIELAIAPDEPTSESGDDAELCTVTGTISLGGAPVAVDCPGARSLDPGNCPVGSVRSVVGWFGPELALSLHALRTARSADHGSDRIRATLFGNEGTRPVDEPRLSTTLREDDLPARTSLELWVGEGDDLYPRRVAGEARGPAVRVASAGLELTGVPLTCHASGLEGVGVYLLARFA
ncbi:MAG: hypothetical protein M3022_10315 [Actinomycetota bacterium]|nr:hypothetical protein [Actinomycetota bacterium]